MFTALSSVQLLVAAGLSLLTFFSWRMYASLIAGAVVKDVPAVGSLLQEQGDRVALALREFLSRIVEPTFLHFSFADNKFGVSLIALTLLLAALAA